MLRKSILFVIWLLALCATTQAQNLRETGYEPPQQGGNVPVVCNKGHGSCVIIHDDERNNDVDTTTGQNGGGNNNVDEIDGPPARDTDPDPSEEPPIRDTEPTPEVKTPTVPAPIRREHRQLATQLVQKVQRANYYRTIVRNRYYADSKTKRWAQKELKKLQAEIKGIQGRIKALEEKYTALAGRVEALEATTGDHEEKIKNLQEDLDPKNTKGVIGKLQKSVGLVGTNAEDALASAQSALVFGGFALFVAIAALLVVLFRGRGASGGSKSSSKGAPGTTFGVTGVTPNTGGVAGGYSVMIQGTGFAHGSRVKFGANSAMILTSTATEIEVEVPASVTLGPVDVIVEQGGVTRRLTDGFTYTP